MKKKFKIKAEELSTKFSDENNLPKEVATKIINALYEKGKDAKQFERVLWRIETFIRKNYFPALMQAMTPEQVWQLVDEMIADDSPCKEEACSSPICCAEDFHVWWFTEMVGEQFKEKTFEAGDTVELQIARVGKWDHPMYGEIEITKDSIDEMKQNFDDNARWIEIAVDENHEWNHRALGWFRKVTKKGEDALFATIELTKKGAELLTEWAYKYFSPEIVFNKHDEESWEIIKNLLIGGAFTNRPFFKAMQPLLANEDFWSEAANRHQTKGEFSDTDSNNILFFNTSKSMKKLLELLAQFCELSTISKAQLEELDAAFAEVKPDYVTPEMTAAVDEIKAKFTEEAAPEATPVATDPAPTPAEETPVDPAPADPADPKETETPTASDPVPASEPVDLEKKIEANEKGEVTLKFSDYESLKGLASEASKLVREARKHKIDEQVSWFTFSETNKIGVVVPRNKQEIVDFALSLSEKHADKFLSIISKLQAVVGGEIGSSEGGEAFTEADEEQVAFFTEKMWMNAEQAKEAVKNAKAILAAKK